MDGHPLVGEIQARDQLQYDRAAILRARRQRFRFRALGVALLMAFAGLVWLWLAATWAVWALGVLTGVLAFRAGKPEEIRLLSPGIRRHVAPTADVRPGGTGAGRSHRCQDRESDPREQRSALAVRVR